MKKIIMMIVAVGVLTTVGTGCTSFETNRAGDQVKVHMDVQAEPEIEAGNKMIEGSATVNCLFGIFTWGTDHQAVGIDYGGSASGFFTGASDVAKNGAAYSACTGANADLLLAARYNLTVKDYFVFKTVECQVKGYPGILKSVKIKK